MTNMRKIVTFALFAVMAMPVSAAELLMFEEDGCVWCARWDAEVAPEYTTSEQGRTAPLVRYDLRRDPLPDSLELNGRVRYTPTFVLVDEDREIGRITGYPGEGVFWNMIDKLLAKLGPGERPPLDSAGLAAGASADENS